MGDAKAYKAQLDKEYKKKEEEILLPLQEEFKGKYDWLDSMIDSIQFGIQKKEAEEEEMEGTVDA